MKRFTQLMICTLALGMSLVGCRQEGVRPLEGGYSKDLLAAVSDSSHPALDTICLRRDAVRFRSSDGSYFVNMRPIVGGGGCQMPAVTTIEWGHYNIYNGYLYTNQGPQHWLDVDFYLGGGFLCDFTNWVFTTNNDIQIDVNTGLPIMGTDWSQLQINPLRSEWKVSIRVDELPSPCFDIACRMSVTRLFLGNPLPGGNACIPVVSGLPNENTRTTLWAINELWNTPGSGSESNNEFALRYCPFGCLETVTPVDTICVNTYVGVAALNGCTTLDATTPGSNVTYAWSTGATSASITPCPTSNTTYSVTISEDGAESLIKLYNVNVTNAACGNGNGNNGIHKVWVCHIPPGNPNNPQDICIDWSGVPAHVARFRAPGSNPRQGHDSGCEIGRCNSNPCD